MGTALPPLQEEPERRGGRWANAPRAGVRMIPIPKGVRMIPIPKGVRMILVPKGVRMILVPRGMRMILVPRGARMIPILRGSKILLQNRKKIKFFPMKTEPPMCQVKTQASMCLKKPKSACVKAKKTRTPQVFTFRPTFSSEHLIRDAPSQSGCCIHASEQAEPSRPQSWLMTARSTCCVGG
jgi:hypothetical protein